MRCNFISNINIKISLVCETCLTNECLSTKILTKCADIGVYKWKTKIKARENRVFVYEKEIRISPIIYKKGFFVVDESSLYRSFWDTGEGHPMGNKFITNGLADDTIRHLPTAFL